MSIPQYPSKQHVREHLRKKYGLHWSENDAAQDEKVNLYAEISEYAKTLAKEKRAAAKKEKETAKETAPKETTKETAPKENARESSPSGETGIVVLDIRKADVKRMAEWIANAPAHIHFHVR